MNLLKLTKSFITPNHNNNNTNNNNDQEKSSNHSSSWWSTSTTNHSLSSVLHTANNNYQDPKLESNDTNQEHTKAINNTRSNSISMKLFRLTIGNNNNNNNNNSSYHNTNDIHQNTSTITTKEDKIIVGDHEEVCYDTKKRNIYIFELNEICFHFLFYLIFLIYFSLIFNNKQ